MFNKSQKFVVLSLILLFGVAACVAPPPRERVVYRDPGAYQNQGEPAYRDEGPRDEGPRYSGRYCHACGIVRDVAQVEIRQGTSGGGAVLGAIIGGVIGNQFGHGGGRAAATAVGVVGGAAVGDSVERDNARANSGYAWRFRVELDDGRLATVTQYENGGLRPGDRVVIRGNHLEPQNR
jgi:outer membrane lipoprotein SlyB